MSEISILTSQILPREKLIEVRREVHPKKIISGKSIFLIIKYAAKERLSKVITDPE